MRAVILMIFLSIAISTQTSAVVAVSHSSKSSSYQSTDKEKDLVKNTVSTKHFSFKKFFKRVVHVFQFDLSDPVDGWLSLAILCFVGALALLLISAIVGGVYILNFIASLLGIGGFVSFIIWALKAFS